MKTEMDHGSAVPMAEMKNIAAEMKRAGLRPKRSEIGPARRTPAAQPVRTQPEAHPFMKSLSPKRDVSGSMAPDITPVSYPKSRPPRVAARQTGTR